MKFVVKRTSEWGDEEPPCPEATKGEMPYWDVRTCSAEEFNRKDHGRGKTWLEEGSDHHVLTNGYIKRRENDRPAWFIELDDLDALMAFYEKYGDLVLTEAFGNNGLPCIEIYDTWRE